MSQSGTFIELIGEAQGSLYFATKLSLQHKGHHDPHEQAGRNLQRLLQARPALGQLGKAVAGAVLPGRGFEDQRQGIRESIFLDAGLDDRAHDLEAQGRTLGRPSRIGLLQPGGGRDAAEVFGPNDRIDELFDRGPGIADGFSSQHFQIIPRVKYIPSDEEISLGIWVSSTKLTRQSRILPLLPTDRTKRDLHVQFSIAPTPFLLRRCVL